MSETIQTLQLPLVSEDFTHSANMSWYQHSLALTLLVDETGSQYPRVVSGVTESFSGVATPLQDSGPSCSTFCNCENHLLQPMLFKGCKKKLQVPHREPSSSSVTLSLKPYRAMHMLTYSAEWLGN